MSVSLVAMWEEEMAGKAEKYKAPGLARVPLDKIGFWFGHRGMPTEDVHEIAACIVTRATSLQQYVCVDLVKIPAAKLEWFRGYNKTMCDCVDYMALFNPYMEYVTVTKTHFTFAHMLIRDGGRTLHDYKMNTATVGIKLRLGDREGQRIQDLGVLASLFHEDLFWKPQAIWSYASQDNMMRH